MDFPGIEKQDITGGNRKCFAVDVGSSTTFCEKKKLVFFMPVRSHPLWAGRIRGVFVDHEMEAYVAVENGFVDGADV